MSGWNEVKDQSNSEKYINLLLFFEKIHIYYASRTTTSIQYTLCLGSLCVLHHSQDYSSTSIYYLSTSDTSYNKYYLNSRNE